MQPGRLRNVLFTALLLAVYYGLVKNTGMGIPCLFRYFFHWKCPGCGVTHMLLYAAEGDFRQAFLSNPVIFCGSPFLVWILGRALRDYIRGGGNVWRKWEEAGMVLFLSVLFIFFLARNLCPVSG